MRGLLNRIRARRAERKALFLDREDARRQAEADALERGEMGHPMWPMGGVRRFPKEEPPPKPPPRD